MKIGGVGLNLTAANNVILSEPWWNPAVDSQAIDRINRIGQTKPMRIFRLLTQGTIEEHIRDIGDKKKLVIDQTVEKCVDLDQQKIESENIVKKNWKNLLTKIE